MRLRQREDQTSVQDSLSGGLALPEGLMVLAIVGIGYPANSKNGHPLASLLFDQVSYEQYGRCN
jgi:hypothetical protein